MADIRIKGKPDASPPQAGDAVPIDRGGTDGHALLGSAAGAETDDFEPAGAAALAQAAAEATAAAALAAHAADTTGVHGIADTSALLDDSDIGTTVQPLDEELSAIADLMSAADRVPYFTAPGVAALAVLTAAARTVLDDATVDAMLATLGGAPPTGYGGLVREGEPELLLPTILGFTFAQHDHQNSDGGGNLDASNVFGSGHVPPAYLGTGTPDATKVLDGTGAWVDKTSPSSGALFNYLTLRGGL